MAESLIFGFIFAFAYRVNADDIESADKPEEQIALQQIDKYSY